MLFADKVQRPPSAANVPVRTPRTRGTVSKDHPVDLNSLSLKAAATPPPHSGPQGRPVSRPSTSLYSGPGALGFLPRPRSSRPPPSAMRRRSSRAAPKTEEGPRAGGGAGAPEPGRSIHAGRIPAATPSNRSLRGERVRARLTWGPQPPQLMDMSPAATTRERAGRVGWPPPASAPSPPPSRPRGPPPPCPPLGFRRRHRRSSGPQHRLLSTPPTHSRERAARLSREELRGRARAKVCGRLKRERRNRKKSLPTCSGAASGAAPLIT